jgi:hypothetical protein
VARSDRRWFIGLCVVSLVLGLALATVLGWLSPRLLEDPGVPSVARGADGRAGAGRTGNHRRSRVALVARPSEDVTLVSPQGDAVEQPGGGHRRRAQELGGATSERDVHARTDRSKSPRAPKAGRADPAENRKRDDAGNGRDSDHGTKTDDATGSAHDKKSHAGKGHDKKSHGPGKKGHDEGGKGHDKKEHHQKGQGHKGPGHGDDGECEDVADSNGVEGGPCGDDTAAIEPGTRR